MTYTIRCKDGQRWKVHKAGSLAQACDAIRLARGMGTTELKHTRSDECVTYVVQIKQPGR